MKKIRINEYEFKDVQFMSAQEKKRVLTAWDRFIRSGFEFAQFTKALYNHLIQHCSFIAHYDRGGFWATYFQDPEDTQRFLDQFDKSKGCVSVEYGMTYWIQGGNDVSSGYYDINTAMVDVLAPVLPQIRRSLRTGELRNAQAELEASQQRVERLRKEAVA